MNYHLERRLLQAAIAVAALVPLSAGFFGMVYGNQMLGESTSLSLDSHVRYLSGLLFGIGAIFWWMIARIEQHRTLVRVLTLMIFSGGLARLFSALFMGAPSLSMQLAIGMEIGVTPLLCLWQGRIYKRYLQQKAVD